MRLTSLLKQPSAFSPLAMSAAALLLIAFVAATSIGVSPDGDEGAPARLFQLLILLQAPIAAVFAWKWIPRQPRLAGLVLALQISTVVIAVFAIVWLERSIAG